MLPLDPDACYRALRARDERFDGRLFVGITSTGIYCRPVCPARAAKREHCRFFPTAAAAQEAGFRPCLRCRPETTAHLGSWRGTSNTVSRGLALIAEGALDGDDGVDELAERLGIGERQLRRLFLQHLGATPVAVAQTRRVLFAKQLLHETRLPMTAVAEAAGFGSLRRFNEVFQALFDRPPSALRRLATEGVHGFDDAAAGVTLRLRYRAPYDWDAMLAHLGARAVEGVEVVRGGAYVRTVRDGDALGTVRVTHIPRGRALSATVRLSSVRAMPAVVTRLRRVFDLAADVDAIGRQLAKDPLLGRLLRARPGLRVPGAWDGFELAVRAVLGQQVSVEAARKLAGKLVRLCGVDVPGTGETALTSAFPAAAEVARADLSALGMPAARRSTLAALARAATKDPHLFEPAETVEQTVERLRAIPGVGEWTAQYIALRAAREPDAFPATDVGLLRGATPKGRARPTSAALLARAETWRPFRAYAAQHLWAADSAARAS